MTETGNKNEPQEQGQWKGNRCAATGRTVATTDKKSRAGEREFSQRSDLEQGFDRWRSGLECGSGTWFRNVVLECETGAWTSTVGTTVRNEDFDRYAAVRQEEETKIRFLGASCVPIFDSETRVSIYRNRAQPKTQDQDSIPSKDKKQNQTRTKQNAEQLKPTPTGQDPPNPPCSAPADLSHRNAGAKNQQQRNTARNNRERERTTESDKKQPGTARENDRRRAITENRQNKHASKST